MAISPGGGVGALSRFERHLVLAVGLAVVLVGRGRAVASESEGPQVQMWLAPLEVGQIENLAVGARR